ncbi:RNA/RNP complex-1-interacting phosphatase-like isoform X2 [Cynoglossus semilaevis]|nr:RNA/RNP complex-1-interacting phosphatase-like isoform X2 [Cynoglossus semilaevis]
MSDLRAATPQHKEKKEKKKKKKKRGIPDRWRNYRPVGRRVPGSRFIAFKTPLKPSLNRLVPGAESFSLWELLDSVEGQNQELGLIIDLTVTTRYYTLVDVPQSCGYVKILTEGQRVPSDATILSFKRAVRHFLTENPDNDRLIGVHCTHGVNRTGYLLCRYLIDVDGLDPRRAVELFNTSRGHSMERQNYLVDLLRNSKRSNSGMDVVEQHVARGGAVDRPLLVVANITTRRGEVSREDQVKETGPHQRRSGGRTAAGRE